MSKQYVINFLIRDLLKDNFMVPFSKYSIFYDLNLIHCLKIIVGGQQENTKISLAST